MLSFSIVFISNQASEEYASSVSVEDQNMLALKRGVNFVTVLIRNKRVAEGLNPYEFMSRGRLMEGKVMG